MATGFKMVTGGGSKVSRAGAYPPFETQKSLG
jgi:hypothetical protein